MIMDITVTASGIMKPVVKKERNSCLSSLKKSVDVECRMPRDKNGIRKRMLLLNKLSSPFSEGRMYTGFVKIKSNKKEAPFAKKFVNV